jgi:acetyl-CoA carboxylase carboxyl transferase subunit alpha
VKAAEILRSALIANLQELEKLESCDLQELRYQKFRRMGKFLGEEPN